MQKKLEAELMSLAHSILKLKKGDDVVLLKDKAYQVYEKLTVLSFIENYVKETPQNTNSVEELISQTFEDVVEDNNESTTLKEPVTEELEKDSVSEVLSSAAKNEEGSEIEEEKLIEQVKENPVNLESSLAKEFGDTISLDIATDIFENAERLMPKKSINDAIVQQKNLQIDLNDRIAFVKNLFEGSQEDFNRVISQLNTMTSEKEALSFFKMIKKDYNWESKEVYEERLLLLIERKFN